MSARLRLPLEIAIILLIAGAVAFLPGGAATARAFEAAILAGFGAGLFFVGLRAYRERRTDIYALGDGRRALLYGTIGVLFVTVAGTHRLWNTGGLGEFFWFAIVGLSIYSFVALYRYARRY